MLIAPASDMSKSLTDNEGSAADKTNVLERELNLTEYERNVRAAHGLPSRASEDIDAGSFVKFGDSAQKGSSFT